MNIYTFEPILTENYDSDEFTWTCDIFLGGLKLFTHYFPRRYSNPEWENEMKQEAMYHFAYKLQTILDKV